MKMTGLRTVILTSAAASLMLAGGVLVPAPATATQTRTEVTASTTLDVPNATTTRKRTPKCVRAIKKEKRAARAEASARNGGTYAQVVAATNRHDKATAARKKACRTGKPDSTVVPFPSDITSQHYNGDPADPRPAGWTRPADGSGLPGSNASNVTVTNCPALFTVSSVVIFHKHVAGPSGPITDMTQGEADYYEVSVQMENYTARPVTVTYEMTALDPALQAAVSSPSTFPVRPKSESGPVTPPSGDGWEKVETSGRVALHVTCS